MTKAEIVSYVAYGCGMSKETAQQAVEATISALTQSFQEGQSVFLRGFATFKVVERKARKARIITKGKTISLPARRDVRLKLCPYLKKRINMYRNSNG